MFASPEKLAREFRRLPATDAVVAAKTQAAAQPTEPVAAEVRPSPTPFLPTGSNADSLLPNFADQIKPKQVVPRLTGQITETELLRNAAPKTAKISLPSRETDPIALPTPRFDSL